MERKQFYANTLFRTARQRPIEKEKKDVGNDVGCAAERQREIPICRQTERERYPSVERQRDREILLLRDRERSPSMDRQR